MSSQLTQRNSFDTESELSPQEPPPWIIRWTACLLIAAFLFALLIAVVMRLPETVNCRFVLIPATGADPIQSPRQATISRVVVEEGQPVKAGEELFVLRSDEIAGWDTQFRTLTEDLRTKQESLNRNETAYAAQVGIKSAEIEQAKSENSDLVVLPETSIQGYTSFDWFLDKEVQRCALAPLEKIIEATKGITAIVGTVRPSGCGWRRPAPPRG